MNITVKNDITIHNVTKGIYDRVKIKLTLDNPDFYKKQRMGKWTGNTPKTISLFEFKGNDIIVPFGCLRELWHLHPVEADWECNISPVDERKYISNINLYPYQEKAVQAVLAAKNGILVMPCGSGKTQTALEIVARVGGRCLWLTHTQDLLNQSKRRAESVFEGCGFGTITAGKIDIGTHITFATVQTMCKVDLQKYKDCFDMIIVDECQHCCGTPTRVTQFYKVLSSLSARYKIGLTATPKRADGLERSMFALLGEKIYEVERSEVADTTCPVEVERIDTEYKPDYANILCGDGTIDYAALVDELTHDEERMQKVSDVINELDGTAIVLANRVAYLEELQKRFIKRSVCLSTLWQSKKAKAERKEALCKLNAGEIDAIFCTYQLAAEGLDVPNLRYVVFATPEKDPTRIQQSAGRVGRKSEGKKEGIVIDFVDDFGMYISWWRKRRSVYNKLGYEVI